MAVTGLDLPIDDFRVVTVQIGLEKAERWIDAARRAGYGDDLSRWLRDLADRRAGVV
jgi:hypothetical protein